MAAISTLLQYISGPGEVANDYNAPKSIHAHQGQNGKLDDFSIGRTAEHRTSLPLDASYAIPPRVLRFGPSRRPRPPPVRPVLPTSQTGPPIRPVWSTELDRSGAVVDPPSLRTWLSAQPRNLQWFCGEPLVKPADDARPPCQASSRKSFASATRTAYSSLPCSLTWSPRSSRLTDG